MYLLCHIKEVVTYSGCTYCGRRCTDGVSNLAGPINGAVYDVVFTALRHELSRHAARCLTQYIHKLGQTNGNI